MNLPARIGSSVRLALPTLVLLHASCAWFATGAAPKKSTPTVLSTGALLPSPRLIVGRIIAVDEAERFAFVDLASDAPKGALIEGTELLVRTLELADKGRLQASAYVRGRTLGTKIVAGQPSPGDEVVWLAP